MTPNNEYNEQIPIDDSLPDIWEEARSALIERSKKLATAINIRTVGWYIDREILTGSKFIPTADDTQEFRDIFRKTFDIGTLPNNGIKNVAHEISEIPENFRLLAMWGAATNTTTGASLPLPYVSIVGNHIDLKMDATNIIITTNSNYSSYNESMIVIEYTTRK